MSLPSVSLKPREERRLLRGHLWAYRNEFAHLPELGDGALVDVFSSERRFVGRGFFQREGGIAVRLLSPRQEDIDAAFFGARLSGALGLRERLFPGQSTYRWVFGESDGLPGLVVDRYGPLAIAQSPAAFYRPWAETLFGLLESLGGVAGVQFRFGGAVQNVGAVPEEVAFDLEGLRLAFAPAHTQKTGLFLDQRLNRLAAKPYAGGKRVLDGHCHHGLWGCHAVQAAAARVLCVDTSEEALECARANAARNGTDAGCAFACARIEEVLEDGTRWDVIILDPPAFAKSRAQAKKAFAAYQTLNAAAMRALEADGILITSSCSHFVDAPDFIEALKRAAAASRRRCALLEMRGAAPDHPVLLAMPETGYLKCAVLRVE